MKQHGEFYVYLKLDFFPVAWATYRGVMMSASTFGTNNFRPISYWSMALLKKVSLGDRKSLIRLEKEFFLEHIRRQYYPDKVSRLHGIYAWDNKENAYRCEKKWREQEGQYFNSDQLIEIGFTYSNLTRVDTQWIDNFIIFNDQPLEKNPNWAHSYWQGEKFNDFPHWEVLIEGQGLFYSQDLRMKAFNIVEKNSPFSVGYLECGRLAACMGESVGAAAPFILNIGPDEFCVAFYMDWRKMFENNFQKKLGKYINTLEHKDVYWEKLWLLKERDCPVPDLRNENFTFNVRAFPNHIQKMLATIVSQRDFNEWPEAPYLLTNIRE